MFNTSGVQQKQDSIVTQNLNENFTNFRNSNISNVISLTIEQTQQGNKLHFCFVNYLLVNNNVKYFRCTTETRKCSITKFE